jgi:hypothetical protein
MTDTAFAGSSAYGPMNYGQIRSHSKIITLTLRNPLLYPLSYRGSINAKPWATKISRIIGHKSMSISHVIDTRDGQENGQLLS